MGKGYNNYMCKKPFHPGSKANIKRTWMAEQRTENEKKKQDELKVQYEKEQDLYNNRALISTESKDKLELNFMYEAPPGAKRERQKEDDEPEYKFEWQRKYNAPREDFAKGNTEIRDQPFGIPVRNVRCIKCHKWGHINTDKECPLFSQASTSSMPATSMDPLELMRQMREDGFNLKQSVLGHRLNPQAANQQLLESEEEDPEIEFLRSLSSKQKRKLLRKLDKQISKQKKSDSSCSKKKKSKKKHKSRRKSSESESEDEKEMKIAKKTAKRQSKQRSSESSDPVDNREEATKQKMKDKKGARQQSDQRSTDESSSESSDSADNPEKSSKQKKKAKKVAKRPHDQRSEESSDSADSRGEACKRKQEEKNTTRVCTEQRKSSDSPDNNEVKPKIKADQQHKAGSDSSDSDSENEKQNGGKDKTTSSRDKCTTGKSEEVKQESSVSKKDSESNVGEKLRNIEGRTEGLFKQQVKDSHAKQGNKRKPQDPSSDTESSSSGSGSSSRESSPESQSKKVKAEPKKSSGSEAHSSGGVEKLSPKAPPVIDVTSEACINEVSKSPEHPDRFTCRTPTHPEDETEGKSTVAAMLLGRKYHGEKDEKFRRINRDRRSPSFKQKYRLS